MSSPIQGRRVVPSQALPTTGEHPPAQRPSESLLAAWLSEVLRRGAGSSPMPTGGPATLHALEASTAVLPPELASRFGLAEGATYGQFVGRLLWARNDPGGPRCRSYRAAAYYLAGRPDALFGPDLIGPEPPTVLAAGHDR
ncbi:MAG TPA: hypothetical protein VHF25_13340 [Nitriliruptorales bacterium]|nr:hypothetical protein [Nitriliruptorales bacterium]